LDKFSGWLKISFVERKLIFGGGIQASKKIIKLEFKSIKSTFQNLNNFCKRIILFTAIKFSFTSSRLMLGGMKYNSWYLEEYLSYQAQCYQ
jgi:hypothetical protein